MSWLGIDIGTSGIKALLTDPGGRVLAEETVALGRAVPQPGWSEQDPAEWWQATLAAVDGLKARAPSALADLRGIGLSGQMHGATLLDAAGEVLRPAILWNDGRAHQECAALEEAAPDLRVITGNIAMPGFTAPKLLWVARHEPGIFARIAKVLLPKDYLRYRLSGEFFSDMSDAAGTLWLDVAGRRWSDRLLEATGLTRDHMPALAEGSAPAGGLSGALRSRWGITGPVVIAGGGGDNAASACGIGAVTPGRGFVSLGTSGVLFVSNDGFRPNTEGAVHAFCHAVPGTWHQMGVILSAADSLTWLAGLTGRSAADLAALAEAETSAPDEEIFLPYLSGERTPHNDAGARGSFAGLSHLSDPARMTRAVMEGVAMALRDCQQALLAGGAQIGDLVAVGGGARSRLWLEIVATLLEQEISLPEAGDYGGAFGAARLARLAVTGEDPAEVCAPPPVAARIAPRGDLIDAYAAQHARFRALYPAIETARRG
ncbi:xylulokinase [Oceanicola sp. S124]|uniref:xylulokinase n=1 Tax=Oceanicola sp. S124 TaxID=1042378 RepID=UPI000255891C|nr:xylulokinase [Oceanicola sp. S124]